MIAHIFKDKHKVAGNIHSLNLLVYNIPVQKAESVYAISFYLQAEYSKLLLQSC